MKSSNDTLDSVGQGRQSGSEGIVETLAQVASKDLRLQLVEQFLEELDHADVWHVVLRNHDSVAAGTENDIDLMADVSDFAKIQRLFVDQCEGNSYIVTGCEVRGKSLFLDAVFRGDSEKRPIAVHFVGFVSVHTSRLQLRCTGLASRVRSRQISRQRLKVGDFECWSPDASARVLFLFQKLFHKPKPKYVSELRKLLSSGDCSPLEDCRDELLAAADEKSTTEVRLNAVRLVVSRIVKRAGFFWVAQEWARLLLANVRSRLRRRGLLVVFSGPDGAGKSTTTENVITFLRDELQYSVISKRGLNPLNEKKAIGKTITRAQHRVRGVSEATPDELETSRRDREPTKGRWKWKLRRYLGLVFILSQYHISYLLVRWKNSRGTMVVIDTAVYDRFVKAHRPRFRWLEKLIVPLLPGGDVVFRLYASPDVIIARKPELNQRELVAYYSAMDEIYALKPLMHIRTISTEHGPDVARTEMIDEMVNLLHATWRR